MLRFLKILSATVLVCLLGAGGWIAWQAYSFLHTVPQTPGAQVLIDVPPGATLARIATTLEQKGVVTDAFKFRLLARTKKLDASLQAGRFALHTGWLPEQVLDTLVNGKPVLTRLTIPEGLTYWQTAALLADKGYATYADLLAMAKDPDFLRHYGIPFATAEGFLMPDTYLLKTPEEEKLLAAADGQAKPAQGSSGEDRAAALAAKRKSQAWKVLGRLVDNFWQKAASCWPDGKKPARDDLKRYVILASIVEKETAIPAERPRVAGVYTNRIARNMLLQADPTVIYGMGENFKGPITRSMLANQNNPYNTYQKAGLTPGPICSFGVSALKAAINPEKHNFLYFVAVRDGGEHTFSRTLSEHNRAVQEYRKTRRQGQ